MDIESWVLEKDIWFDLSCSRSDHRSLVRGHSSKKGRRELLSCFMGCSKPKSFPRYEDWCCCLMSCIEWSCRQERTELLLALESGNDGKGEGTWHDELCTDESTPRPFTLPEASDMKLCMSSSVFTPLRYLRDQNCKFLNEKWFGSDFFQHSAYKSKMILSMIFNMRTQAVMKMRKYWSVSTHVLDKMFLTSMKLFKEDDSHCFNRIIQSIIVMGVK